LDAGADVNAKAGDGCTALHLAASYAYTDIVKLLLPIMFNPNSKDHDGQTPLHLVARSSQPKAAVLAVVEMLVAKGANVNARANDGATPLREAGEGGYPEVAQLLKQHGATE
jgi:ankyrin repeat protein